MLLCRYLGELKSNVRNKAHPEGYIAESVLAKEAMVLCSGFLDGFQSLVNKLSRTNDNDETLGCNTVQASALFPYAGMTLGKPRSYVIRGLAKLQAHRYVLFNCSDFNTYLRYNLKLININSIFFHDTCFLTRYITGLTLNKSRLTITDFERAIEMSRKCKMRSSINGLEAT